MNQWLLTIFNTHAESRVDKIDDLALNSSPGIYLLPILFIGTPTVPERVSAPIVFVSLPGKIVLEVVASGTYGFIYWTRNRYTLGVSAPALLSEFVNFFEIFVREPAVSSDYGVYEVVYSGRGGLGVEIQVVPTGNVVNCHSCCNSCNLL